MRHENRIALITAAASGMGRAGALLFAKEGAKVVAADIDEQGVEAVVREITDGDGEATAITADLTKDAEAKRIVHAAVDACSSGRPAVDGKERVIRCSGFSPLSWFCRSIRAAASQAWPSGRFVVWSA